MVSDLDTKVPTEQSVKAYVDALKPLTFNATAINVVVGTLTDGVYGDLAAHNGNYVIVTEVTTNGFTLDVTFDNVTSLTQILLYGRYQGNVAHEVGIYLYNKDTTNYDLVELMDNNATDEWHSTNVFDGAHYLDSGTVIVRFVHLQNGVAGHTLNIDYMVLKGNTTVSGGGVTEHTGLTGLLHDDHTQYLKEEASGGLASEVPDHDHSDGTEAGTIDHVDLDNVTAAQHHAVFVNADHVNIGDTSPHHSAAHTLNSHTTGYLDLPEATQTIASNTITVTKSFNIIDTQGGAGTDELDTISGYAVGMVLVLMPTSGARVITVRHGIDNIALKYGQNCVLSNTADTITLIGFNGLWNEVSRAVTLDPQRLFLGHSSIDISGGGITADGSFITLDTDGGAATDELDTITGFYEGKVIVLKSTDAARVITVKHVTGNIALKGSEDCILASSYDSLTLIYYSGWWQEISRTSGSTGSGTTQEIAGIVMAMGLGETYSAI